MPQVHSGSAQSEIQLDSQPSIPQALRQRGGRRQVRCLERRKQDVHARVSLAGRMFANHQLEPFETVGEAHGRDRLAAAERTHQIVVATAAAQLERALRPVVIGLEHQTRVVAQATPEAQIDDHLRLADAVARQQRQRPLNLAQRGRVELVLGQQRADPAERLRRRAGDPLKLDDEIDRVATERLLAKKRGANARAELARDLDNLTKSPLWKAKDILVDLSNSSRSILAAQYSRITEG